MSLQQGAIYGTVLYGEATYGRPLNLSGTTLPTYSAAPAQAVALSYVSVLVTWSLPTNGVTLRLVRNGYSIPADENDGAVLLTQAATASPVFTDDTLTANSSGSTLYYTLWNQDSAGNWWRASDLQTILPANWGYDNLLVSLLPSWYMENDDLLADVSPVGVSLLTWQDLSGLHWTAMDPFVWDYIIPPPP